MANIVNNLRINGQEVKGIKIKLPSMTEFASLKEFYYNGILVWKNANPFLFTSNIHSIDLKQYGENTIIFEGFSPNFIYGSYNIVENAEAEKINLVKGQMVVEVNDTTEGEK